MSDLKEALTVMNTVTASVSGENLEKSRCKMQLCKQLGIPAHVQYFHQKF
jgi:hypothetical protein